MHPWLNWIEHRPPKAGIARSNRAGCASFFHQGQPNEILSDFNLHNDDTDRL